MVDVKGCLSFTSLELEMSTAFNTLANFQIPTPCRILPTSCCLDKDLVVLISRLGSLDRISLWNTTQGTKIWEVEVGEDVDSAYVVDLAWSPDGESSVYFLSQWTSSVM
jgi:anaphase-promoting complex subunit 4